VIVTLAGGVGAARFLAGLTQVIDPSEVTAIVNVADDFELHGLRISPDLDTVTYTLAGQINPETGWGRAGETWRVMDELDTYGGQTWFRLGDLDLALHLYRTQRYRDGVPLSQVTAEVARSKGLRLRILPVTDDPVATRVVVAGEGERQDRELSFQDWFVGHRHQLPVEAVRFDGADRARAGPGVLAAIRSADVVVVAPSNPVVSIAPVLAVPGVRDAVRARPDRVVAVSPIVAGRALKGPAAELLDSMGEGASAVGVARWYSADVGTIVIDDSDADDADAIRALGLRCTVTDTIMRDRAAAAALARAVIAAVTG
jgi:LPPG:FO 2-phospho-L-lactate transferase